MRKLRREYNLFMINNHNCVILSSSIVINIIMISNRNELFKQRNEWFEWEYSHLTPQWNVNIYRAMGLVGISCSRILDWKRKEGYENEEENVIVHRILWSVIVENREAESNQMSNMNLFISNVFTNHYQWLQQTLSYPSWITCNNTMNTSNSILIHTKLHWMKMIR